MYNPFSADIRSKKTDKTLVQLSLEGDREALVKLVTRHQPWIYNITFRMVLVAEDAEDITQEILIKMMTKLSTYDAAKGAFRTWLYRIVANHVMNIKIRGYEKSHFTLDDFYSFVEEIPDKKAIPTAETSLVIKDVMVGCVLGALLCLDRQQRLVFILGVVFNVPSRQGGEIADLTSAHFRKILSRARAKLYNFMNNKCSVVNKNAPCKCRNKPNEFIRQGFHKIDNVTFCQENTPKVTGMIEKKIGRFEEVIYSDFVKLYQDHPFYESQASTEWLKMILDQQEFKEIFDFN